MRGRLREGEKGEGTHMVMGEEREREREGGREGEREREEGGSGSPCAS